MISQKKDPELWETSKALACTKAGLCDHSARKMQWATRHYKSQGGRYVGKKSSRNRLSRWTAQRWSTQDGSPSEGVRRYLPAEAWKLLSADQVRRTNESKRRGSKSGKQYVRQPPDVARIAARVRSEEVYPWMSYHSAHRREEEAVKRAVSEVARGSGGFMRIYEKHGKKKMERMPVSKSSSLTWGRKRHNFVKRHMAQYVKHPTRRRWLALVMWAYLPPGPVPSP